MTVFRDCRGVRIARKGKVLASSSPTRKVHQHGPILAMVAGLMKYVSCFDH